MQNTAYRRLTPVAAWTIATAATPGRPLDERLLPLVEAVARTGTLVAAARACDIPYRTAWSVLEAATGELGAPLVTLARGRGASLTPMAQRWLAANDAARRVLEQAALRVEIDARSTASRRGATLLKMAASHDLAIAQLKDRWRLAERIVVEFRGSAESLDALRAGAVDVAGFHVAATSAGEVDPLLARLSPSRDAILGFITRTQGLMLARGNPRRVRDLADLASRRMTIVNRQPGSGTRLLFDRLLARAEVSGDVLRGYENEEFTHAAVAATVASGRADAAFGIQAAAAQFGLAFVPLVTEHYRFACRRRTLDTPRMRMFRALLASRATRAVVAPLPGYALDAPGDIVSFAAG